MRTHTQGYPSLPILAVLTLASENSGEQIPSHWKHVKHAFVVTHVCPCAGWTFSGEGAVTKYFQNIIGACACQHLLIVYII